VIERGEHDGWPMLWWRFPSPMRVVASSPLGGGIGVRRWVVNAQVVPGYARTDLEEHLSSIAGALGLDGAGVGMLTAARVLDGVAAHDGGVDALATVGLGQPEWAAAPDQAGVPLVGTINIVAVVPVRLSDAALVNAVATATEAKVQALVEAGVDGSGTATDAVCVACLDRGPVESFGGPRSTWGARLARAVHASVRAGLA
jgi:adenosylcobinamide hydrolase